MSKPKNFSDMPGPVRWPLVGNALQLASFPEKTLLKWANENYGNVFRYRMFGTDCVALNGYDAVYEGLVSNKSAMSGRITGPLFESTRDNRGLFFLDYGDTWKKLKHFALESVGSVMSDLPDRICNEADKFMSEVLQDAAENDQAVGLADDLRYRLAQVVLISFLDKEFPSSKRKELEGLIADIYTPFSNYKFPLLMLAPSMSNLSPFSSFLTEEKSRREKVVNQLIGWIEEHHKDSKSDLNDITHAFYEENTEPTREDLESFALLLIDMVFAGTTTVKEQILWVILFLLKHPDMKEEVQLELDEAMKDVDSISDLYRKQEKVPFLKSVIQETLRLRPIAPGSLFHKTVGESQVGGYKIPKDVVIFPNLWSIHHDPMLWGSDVETFRPDRYLDEEGKFMKSNHVIPFSIGDRKCAGEEIARADIFIFLVSILLKYDIALAEEYKDVDMTGVSAAILQAPEFKVVAKKRECRSCI